MKITVKAENDFSDIERQQMDALCDQAFAAAEMDDEHAEGTDYVWVMSNDWHILVEEDGKFVSHVGIVERTCTVAGQPLKLGGIGGVATMPGYQKRGLASAAMRFAEVFMCKTLKLDFGLLVCARHREPLYRSLGWREVPGPLVFDQPQGKVTFKDVTMIIPCNKQDWPTGVIDLCGLPW
jgi:predicted N-acetyltransferase YhbS